MISSSIVLEKLTSSFQTLPYPGDLNLVYDNTGNHLECVEIQQTFAGKHWSELSQETLIRESSALAFLTPEAFRFYLPAYLSNVVQDFDESDALHYSQVKLKALLSMSNLTHFLPVDPIKI